MEKEGYNIIQSYTTRPPRKPGEWGHTFVDSSESDLYVLDCIDNSILPNKNVIAYQELYGHHYWVTKEQYQGKGTSIYVVDPNGAEQVRQNVDDAEIVTIFLMADEATREVRIFERENKTKYKNEPIKGYIAWGNTRQRLKQDKEIFSSCKCNYVVDANREVDEVLADVKRVIEE